MRQTFPGQRNALSREALLNFQVQSSRRRSSTGFTASMQITVPFPLARPECHSAPGGKHREEWGSLGITAVEPLAGKLSGSAASSTLSFPSSPTAPSTHLRFPSSSAMVLSRRRRLHPSRSRSRSQTPDLKSPSARHNFPHRRNCRTPRQCSRGPDQVAAADVLRSQAPEPLATCCRTPPSSRAIG